MAKPQNHMRSEMFERGTFLGQIYRRMDDQKLQSGLPKLKVKMSKLRDVLNKLVQLKLITNGVLGSRPQKLGDFLEKQAILIP